MAIAAQTLADESACYVCAGASLAQAFELALLARIVANGGGSGGSGNHITTETGLRITTETGLQLITE